MGGTSRPEPAPIRCEGSVRHHRNPWPSRHEHQTGRRRAVLRPPGTGSLQRQPDGPRLLLATIGYPPPNPDDWDQASAMMLADEARYLADADLSPQAARRTLRL